MLNVDVCFKCQELYAEKHKNSFVSDNLGDPKATFLERQRKFVSDHGYLWCPYKQLGTNNIQESTGWLRYDSPLPAECNFPLEQAVLITKV